MLACSDHRKVDVAMWIALSIAPASAYMAPQGCTSINAQNRFPDHMFGVDNTSNSLGWPSINMLACPEHRDIDVTMWIAPSMAPGAWRRG